MELGTGYVWEAPLPTDHYFKVEDGNLPTTFHYRDTLPDVHDQGQTQTCLCHTCSSWYDWFINVNIGKHDVPIDSDTSIYNIYDKRANKGDGMTYHDGLAILRKNGFVTTEDYEKGDASNALKIGEYARVGSVLQLQNALIMNGPCPTAFIVRDFNRSDFWNGKGNYGGHAVAVVGWVENYRGMGPCFMIRNSWGVNWGDDGYCYLPFSDFGCMLEIWTIMK